jgi:PPOX class probable F420-dependent enzyme
VYNPRQHHTDEQYMELSEATPLLRDNHTAVVSTVGPSGKVQNTVISTALFDGKVAFASRPDTVKVRNIQHTGRATVTVIKLDTRRYVTVEGPAVVKEWDEKAAAQQIALLRDVYTAMGRPPEKWDDFESSMRSEQRSVVLVTPERVYGSLTVR